MTRRLAVTVLASLLATSPAAADIPIGLIEELGLFTMGSIDQTRRSIAIGPHVGYVGGVDVDGDGLQGISFGLAIYRFKRPSILELKERITAIIQSRVEDRLEQMIAAGSPPADLKQLVAEVGHQVLDELDAQVKEALNVTPKLLERPSLKLIVEGVKLFDSGGQVRLGVSKGFGYVSVGLAGAVQRANGETTPILGAELSVHLTPTGRLRTPVIDGYTRGDVGFADAGTSTMFLLGIRALVDLL